MKVLIISTDLGLLGEKAPTGDVISRHIEYGRYVEQISIIVFSPPGYQSKQLSQNVFSHPTNSHYRWEAIFSARRIFKKILATAGQIDLIVCQDPFLTGLVGLWLKKKYKIKLLVHFHGDFWRNHYWLEENPLRILLLMLSHFITPRADAIRVVSAGIRKKLLQAGIKKDKVVVIPTPVNLNKISSPDNQTVQSIRRQFSGQTIILWLGKMRSEKNLPFLLKCFNQLSPKFPSAVLILAGSGKDFDRLRAISAKLTAAEKIHFIGHTDYSQTVNYFHATDIFVLPSRHESFGKVLLEAGMAGKPSVASATTGAREIIIDNQTGFLVPVNNKKQFIARLSQLLQKSELRIKMGAAAHRHIKENFNYQFSVAQIVDYWKKIIQPK